jgi:hypothetical protein
MVVGRIFNVHAAPVGMPWMWTLAFGQHEDRHARLCDDASSDKPDSISFAIEA